MSTKINISIPQPCHENWEGMTTIDKGKFCASCQKKVFDFTRASDREIITAYEQNQNLCGRFLNTQLRRDLTKQKEKSSAWIAAATAFISFISIGSHDAIAQEQPVKTEQTDQRMLGKFLVTKPAEIEVSGTVSDKTGPLPGASIYIKGTEVNVSSDFDGNFTIKAKKNDILVVTFMGYDSKEIEIINERKINVSLEENVLLGEVVTVGGIYGKKRTFFGRIFHAIGNWFR